MARQDVDIFPSRTIERCQPAQPPALSGRQLAIELLQHFEADIATRGPAVGFEPNWLAVQSDTPPFDRHGHALVGNIEDPTGNRLAVMHQADDHGEAVAAGSEVRRAVERIDDPATLARPADQIEQAGILLDRLLAHHRHAGQDPCEPRGQALLGGDVGHRDDVARALVTDVFLGEIAETRQQLSRRRLTHQLGDSLGIAGAEHRPQPRTPNRSSSFRIT